MGIVRAEGARQFLSAFICVYLRFQFFSVRSVS